MMHVRKQPFLLLTLFVLCSASITSYAQSLKEFFANTATPLTYLGVDFSLTKIQGETATPTEIKEKFEPINAVIITEVKKYDVTGAFKRTAPVTNYTEAINKVNDDANVSKMKTDNVSDLGTLTPAEIAKHVKVYNLSGKSGIGLVFIMDGMSKTNKEAAMYAVLLDLGTKKVLNSEKITGKAQGFGFRNYWAYTVYKVLHTISTDKYKDWANAAAAAPEEKVAEAPKADTAKPKAKKGKKAV
ncbi:hypothetical protein [Chitinophaga sancti]|uniref:hypothetical protein n=1 Tax=Chitinophaga sancti TaxID=1004 RepID=UPI003F793886